ncbi:hypothetical protein [Parasitella parasitica]|uniref:Uncharacterized protein n=1 Tax=Parasitella parasitica TaxID=35722 RepID=A0A0B7MVK7_9FUNG|nr:hypothetical protein [Parasitella parasitica]
MRQQQCLNAQMQLRIATNNIAKSSLPGFPTVSSPMQPLTPQPFQPPIVIKPTVAMNNNNNSRTSSSVQQRRKKKTRWVRYETSGSS